MLSRLMIASLIGSLVAGNLGAQVGVVQPATTQAAAPNPYHHQLEITPSKAPAPALKYYLMPDVAEQTAGNAATMYLLASTVCAAVPKETLDRVAALNDMKLDALPKEEARQLIERHADLFTQVDIAARRDSCVWDTSLREQSFKALLPHLGYMRWMAHLVRLRARLAIAEQRWDDAAYSLRTGFGLSEDLGADALLIQALVGSAIEGMMCKTVREWIATPDSPNLYWALANVKRPMFDLLRVMQNERGLLYQAFPALKEARQGRITPQQWDQVLIELDSYVRLGAPGRSEAQAGMARALGTAVLLPSARAGLLKRGVTEAELNQMPPAAIVARHVIEEYQEWSDEQFKWFGLPVWQAAPGLKRSGQAFAGAREGNLNPLMVLAPDLVRARISAAQADRMIAELMTIEAIRAHLAEQQGRLPKALQELVDHPVPVDPMTGTPLEFQPTETGFTLEAPPAPGDRQERSVRYQVTIRR